MQDQDGARTEAAMVARGEMAGAGAEGVAMVAAAEVMGVPAAAAMEL